MYAGSPEIVIYFIIAAISIIGNCLVVWSLWKLGRSVTCFTYLLWYLHCTTIVEEFLTLPYLWKENYTVCQIVESFHCYIGFMNILTIAILVEVHISSIFSANETSSTSNVTIKELTLKYGKYLLFGIPLVVFIGFANHTYGKSHVAFCVVPSHLGNLPFLFLYFLEIWALLFYSAARMIYSLIKLYRYDSFLARKYFSSIGFYIVIGILGWIPRSVIRFTHQYAEDDDGGDDNTGDNNLFLFAFYPLQIAGICFALIYFREKNAIKTFASYNHAIDEVNKNGTGRESEMFSWDEILNHFSQSESVHNSKSLSTSVVKDHPFFKSILQQHGNSSSNSISPSTVSSPSPAISTANNSSIDNGKTGYGVSSSKENNFRESVADGKLRDSSISLVFLNGTNNRHSTTPISTVVNPMSAPAVPNEATDSNKSSVDKSKDHVEV
jgi:hypothetical protein